MQQRFLLPLVFFAITGVACALYVSETEKSETTTDRPAASAASEPVNAVLGDASFVARFGHAPGPDADEAVRLRTHLAYVEQLLRARPTDHLSPALRAARARNLDRLHAYWTAGRFPRNYDAPGERQPTFIDREGRICAVGYLIEQSAGRAVAERINARYKHAFIREIDTPVLDQWATASGLTKQELAMIQPQYDGDDCVGCVVDGDEPMNEGVEVGVMALNAGAAVVNGVLAARRRPSYVTSGAGLAAGATGLAVGLSDRANYSTGDALVAGVSLLASTWNLTAKLRDREQRQQTAALVPETQVAVLPTRGQPPKLGLSMRWTF